jgi:hypothetical protein
MKDRMVEIFKQLSASKKVAVLRFLDDWKTKSAEGARANKQLYPLLTEAEG